MKVLTIIGTRPEAVKMAPVLRALKAHGGVTSLIADTGQHADLLAPHLHFFGLEADVRLGLMRAGADPRDQVRRMVLALDDLIGDVRPDRVIVQGDTSSALAGALAASQRAVPIAHVEAGLRSHHALPWPEEAFRREIDARADLLLAPTPMAAANLEAEQLGGHVHVTGNSGIDALHFALAALGETEGRSEGPPTILATIHRRESVGAGTEAVCAALLRLVRGGHARVVMPVHPNPAIGAAVRNALAGQSGIALVEPLGYPQMVAAMRRADLILTDSGGLQEEAPTLGKRVLVLRDVTERPEGLALGLATLVGLREEAIYAAAVDALAAPPLAGTANPYGDGQAAGRIVAALMGVPFSPFACAEPMRMHVTA